MPHRSLVIRELATFLGVLSHPQRIRIVAELREGECDVTTLQNALGISHSGVSQHLMVLRAHRIVAERKQGRQVFYRLLRPELASWLLASTEFLEADSEVRDLQAAIQKTRRDWAIK